MPLQKIFVKATEIQVGDEYDISNELHSKRKWRPVAAVHQKEEWVEVNTANRVFHLKLDDEICIRREQE